MAKIARYNGNLKSFGSNATGLERTVFGDITQSDTLDANINIDFLRGWGIVGINENPTKQDFNGLAFTLGQLIAYLHQVGVPEWNAAQEYFDGSVVTTATGVFRLKAGGDGSINPDVDGDVNWEGRASSDARHGAVFSSITELLTQSLPVGISISVQNIGPYIIAASGTGLTLANGNIAVPEAINGFVSINQYNPNADGSDDTAVFVAAGSTGNKVAVENGRYLVTGTVNGDFHARGTDVKILGVNTLLIENPTSDYYDDKTTRGPTQKDYSQPKWKLGTDVYTPNRVFSGTRASWSRNKKPWAIIPDATSVLGCYWMKRLYPAYAGPCIAVSFEGVDVPVDINFLPNGELDTEALFAVTRSGVGRIHTWYDQSGNANHLTSSGVNRPTIKLSRQVGGMLGIVFENLAVYNGATNPEQFLTIPVGVATNSNSVTIQCLVNFANSVATCPLVTLNGTSYTALGYKKQTGINTISGYVNNSARFVPNYQPALADEFIGYSASGSEIIAYANGESGVYAAASSVALAGGKIGTSDSSIFLTGGAAQIYGGSVFGGLIINNAGTTLGELNNTRDAIIASHDIYPQVNNNVVFDGDSITEGAFATYFDNFPTLVNETLNNKFKTFNMGKGGGTVATQSANSYWAADIYDATVKNVAIVSLGTNDIGGGFTDTQLYDAMVVYIQTLQGIGYDVIVGTVYPRVAFNGNPTQEGYRLAYNQSMRDNAESLGLLGIIDFANEPTMGSTTNVANTIYYTDGTHPTPYGYELLASFAATELKKILSLNW